MPLVVCGAPIGNPADASPRLAAVLSSADVLAAEDTRRLRRLASDLGVQLTGRLVSYFAGNEAARTAPLVAELLAGRTVALITDGGMPAVSDPGYRLVSEAAAAGVAVSVVPGPSALTAALAVSGLPSDRVAFEGFLPRRAGERRVRLAQLRGEVRTMVILEAPHRLAATLADLAAAFGPQRPAVLARELTKTFEQVVRRPLGELAELAAAEAFRGECTLVVAGASGQAEPVAAEDLVARVRLLEAQGVARREATSRVAGEAGVGRRQVFDALLAAKHGPAG